MIRLADVTPGLETLGGLSKLQNTVDQQTSFSTRVSKAAALWRSKASTRSGARTFTEVKSSLRRQCAHAVRCAYCEDSVADEIEHIWPKSLFPERAFVWGNYCFACGPCNGPKQDGFALFPSARSARLIRLRRGVAPPVGEAVLLDPRSDEPTAFLIVDVLQTFRVVPAPRLSPRQRARASYTIELLRLNREYLVEARRHAAESFEAALRSYVGARPRERRRWREHIEHSPHPTVWVDLIRFHDRVPGMRSLVRMAPEVLTWRVGQPIG